MSHFLTYVVSETGEEEEITRLLAPYDENDEWFREGSRWDWWVVGGRFTGSLDGYDPASDPANVETCNICAGTGDRPGWVFYEDGERKFADDWARECNGCNACQGEGKKTSWPTQWAAHEGDTAPVSFVLERYAEPVPRPAKVLAAAANFAERERLWDALAEEDKRAVTEAIRTPMAVVTPDGEWHEQARMGWFGMTMEDEDGRNDEKPEKTWRAAVVALLEQNPDAVVTVVDCHV